MQRPTTGPHAENKRSKSAQPYIGHLYHNHSQNPQGLGIIARGDDWPHHTVFQDTTGHVYMWTYSTCVSKHKIHTRSTPDRILAGREEVKKISTSGRETIGNRWLLGVVEPAFFKDVVSEGLSMIQEVALHPCAKRQCKVDSVSIAKKKQKQKQKHIWRWEKMIVEEKLKRGEWKMDYLHALYIMYRIIEK